MSRYLVTGIMVPKIVHFCLKNLPLLLNFHKLNNTYKDDMAQIETFCDPHTVTLSNREYSQFKVQSLVYLNNPINV